MDPLKRPETVVQALRRYFRARMLGPHVVGAGALAVGAVGVPFLMACSCPSWTARIVHPVSPADIRSDISEAELCAAVCGGPVDSCAFGYMPTLVSEGEPAHDPIMNGPPESNVVMCEVQQSMTCGMGRPPEGLVRPPAAPGELDALAAYFAGAAHLEAASVLSFVQFATELEAHGAPDALIRGAEQAAVDEVRHARATADLARTLGATPRGPTVWVPAPRPLRDVLRENAAVGGVEETFGAWVLAQQARDATDERVRALTTPVAIDEARHAKLARQVDDWGRPALTAVERRVVDDAVDEATQRLADQMQHEPAPELAEQAGLPSATCSQKWFT